MPTVVRSNVYGIVFNVMRYSTHDGPGIRTTVFLKGCPLRCLWCHNPESLNPRPQIMFSLGRCIGCRLCQTHCPQHALEWNQGPMRDLALCQDCGDCAEACPTGARAMAGRKLSTGELLDELLRDAIFYLESGGGVTFSGGEPFAQPEFLEAALEALGAQGIHRTVDTSGLVDPSILLRLLPKIDLFLYDLKAADEQLHIRLTGQSNRRILDNLRTLAAHRANVILRMPLVAGLNDGDAQIEDTLRAIAGLGFSRIDLLPYHDIGMDKHERLGGAAPGLGLAPPSAERLQHIAQRFTQQGFSVNIGG